MACVRSLTLPEARLAVWPATSLRKLRNGLPILPYVSITSGMNSLFNNVNVFNDILEGINIQATAGIFTLSLPFYFISKRSSCLEAYLELIKKIPWKEHCQDWSRVEL